MFVLFIICCFLRAKNTKKQYAREDVQVKSKNMRKRLDKAEKKLNEYEKRDVNILNLRRSVYEAEIRANQLEQELKSLKTEHDRVVERFVCN